MQKHVWSDGFYFFQNFDLEIKDKKGTKNIVADHLSRLADTPSNEPSIEEFFSNK